MFGLFLTEPPEFTGGVVEWAWLPYVTEPFFWRLNANFRTRKHVFEPDTAQRSQLELEPVQV